MSVSSTSGKSSTLIEDITDGLFQALFPPPEIVRRKWSENELRDLIRDEVLAMIEELTKGTE